MSGFENRSDLPPPPQYEWSQHDFDSKVATATERSLHQSFAPVSGPSHSFNENEFEKWSDEKFKAAARAYEARQAMRRMQGTPQPGASGSSSVSGSNSACSSGMQHNVSGPQTYPLDRSQTPRPSDYAQPYSRAPTSAPSNATSNEDRTIATGGGLQRAVSLFRTPSISPNDDHGEQLPAFTDVALPEEMVPQDLAQRGPTSPPPTAPPPTAPQSPPPPHTFSAPSCPPPSLYNGRTQMGPRSPPPTVPRSPPPPHTFSAPLSPPSSLHIPPPPPPPLNVPCPLSLSPATAPASPIHSDPPPAFMPSNSHYPTPEKTNPYAHPQLGNARAMSNPMSVYTSATRTHAQPSLKFDLGAAYGRSASPGPPTENGASFYSSAVSSTMTGRPLPKPSGGRPRNTLPPEPRPWTGVSGQPDPYGHTGAYASQHQQNYQPGGFTGQALEQQPYQAGGFYGQALGQQPNYGQDQPSQQGTHWGNQYPNYGVTTPPPGGQGQPWSVQPPWPGNGGHYRQ